MESYDLKGSSKRIGQLYPILVDYNGQIIDGKHRAQVNGNWRKIRLEHIKTEKDRLIATIIANNARRKVSQKEKMSLLNRLGEIYLSDGIKPGRISYKMAKELGMSHRWVLRYLPSKFKDSFQSNRASSAARLVAKILSEFSKPPKDKGMVDIKKYKNGTFVAVILEKYFFEEFQRDSLELGVQPEISLHKAINQYHKKIRRGIRHIKKLNVRIEP